MTDILTTGQVARICKVSTRTVNKWFDCGKLRGHRDPGSQIRRVPKLNLIQFLQDYGMPLGELEADVAPIRGRAAQHRRQARALAQKGEYAQAICELDQAQVLLPDTRAVRLRGFIYYRLGDYAKALADLDAVLPWRGNDRLSHIRARIHYRQGSYHAALNDLNNVILFNPNAAAYRLRGRVHRLLSELDQKAAAQLAGQRTAKPKE